MLESPDGLYKLAVSYRQKWSARPQSGSTQCRDVEAQWDTCVCCLPLSALPEAPHPSHSLKLKECRSGTLSTTLNQGEGQAALKTQECRAFQHPFVP